MDAKAQRGEGQEFSTLWKKIFHTVENAGPFLLSWVSCFPDK